jgi:hypothetical protein
VQSHDIGAVFYPDIPKDEHQRWLKLLVNHPKALSFYSPKNLSYTEIDTVFIYCEKDAAFPYPAQKAVCHSSDEKPRIADSGGVSTLRSFPFIEHA